MPRSQTLCQPGNEERLYRLTGDDIENDVSDITSGANRHPEGGKEGAVSVGHASIDEIQTRRQVVEPEAAILDGVGSEDRAGRTAIGGVSISPHIYPRLRLAGTPGKTGKAAQVRILGWFRLNQI